MHIFSVRIGQLQRDVTDDKEVLRDWDFPVIHRTVHSNSGCLEVSVNGFIVQHLLVMQTVVRIK